MKKEIKWKPIYFNNEKTSYEISNTGKVRNTITGNILSTKLKDGNVRVSLKGYRGIIHRSVASIMLKEFKNQVKTDDNQLYFYDGNRLNLDIDNMDYLTYDEIYNIIYDSLFEKIDDEKFVLKNGNEIGEYWKRLYLDNICMHYAISSNGRILNLSTRMFLNPTYPSNGAYPFITLRHSGKIYRFTLHRLIAELFVENKDPKNCVFVNHINENKNDFRAKNLEWVTPSENVLYSIKTGTNKNCGETSKSSKITEEIANKICELIQEGYRTCEIVSILGVNRNTIRHIREGDT